MSWELTCAIGFVLLLGTARPFFFSGRTGWLEYHRGTQQAVNPFLVSLSIFASLAGGFMVFGLVQLGFEGGASGYVLGATYVIGMPLLAMGFKYVNLSKDGQKGVFIIDAIVEEKYGKATLFCFFLLSSLLFAGVLAAQFSAISFYLRTFTSPGTYVVVLGIGCLGTLAYTVIFGFKGVLANDYIQGILILAVSLIIPCAALGALNDSEGIKFAPLANGLGGDYGIVYPIFGLLTLLPSFLVRADLWQRVRLAHNRHRGWVLLGTGLLLAWFYFAMTTTGLLFRQNPSLFIFVTDTNPGDLVPVAVERLVTNSWFQVICLSGILYALLSSIDSYLNIVAVSLVRIVIWNVFYDQTISDEKRSRIQTLNARILTIAVFLLAVIMALLMPDIVDLLSASFAGIGILLPVCAIALFKKSANKDYVGSGTIIAGTLVLAISLPFLKKLAFIPAVAVALLVFTVLFFAQSVNNNTTTDKTDS